MKTLIRVFAWLLLFGSAIASFAAAIWVDASGQFQSLVLVARGPGSLANWLFFFLTLSLAGCVYLLRGIEAGGWSISLRGVALVFRLSVVLLVTGVVGLAAVGAVCTIAGRRWLGRRPSVGGI
jgi:hypothetical protein